MEITVAQLGALPHAFLVDVRDAEAYAKGHLPGAVHFAAAAVLTEGISDIPKDKPLVFYCQRGDVSKDIVSHFSALGYSASHLFGGYIAWVVEQTLEDKSEAVEQSIRKKFHKAIFSQFTRAVRDYELVQPEDKIAVCISGGKDSMLLAKLFQELTRHKKVPFTLEFLVMDPGYATENRALIEKNAKQMDIPITVFETDIFAQVFTASKNACYLCARMRRGYLYSKAQELGCNKIALGHHFDDVIETNLLNMLYGGQVQTMMPKLKSTNFSGMELIRPLYYVREADIIHFRQYHDLHFLQCACRFTDSCSIDGSMQSKRTEIKALIKQLKEGNPTVEHSIFKSMENVHMDAVLGYKVKGEKRSFLEGFSSDRKE